jgi:hypothetical protein
MVISIDLKHNLSLLSFNSGFDYEIDVKIVYCYLLLEGDS